MGGNRKEMLTGIENRDEVYNSIADIILEDILDNIVENTRNGKDVMIIYDSFVGRDGTYHKGFDNVFKIDGLVEIINKYFLKYKIDLVAKKDEYNKFNVIRFSEFKRIKGGYISKDDRRNEKDDIAIIDTEKEENEDSVAREIEKKRRFMMES